MGIRIETDLDFDKTVIYLKDDPEQLPHRLVGVILLPGSVNKKGERGIAVMLRLSYIGEIVEVYDYEVSTERDELQAIEANGKE